MQSIECKCGATLKVPDIPGKAVRCRKCRAIHKVQAQAPVVRTRSAREPSKFSAVLPVLLSLVGVAALVAVLFFVLPSNDEPGEDPAPNEETAPPDSSGM